MGIYKNGVIDSTKTLPVIVSPDAGSLKKIYKVVDQFGLKTDIVIASKHRDLEGKITHTEVPLREEHDGRDFLIIDDICDGGRTFVEISKEIERTLSNTSGDVNLVVTHGIFSAGFTELENYFDKIYCTNSVSDITDDKRTKLVYQLNVLQ